MNVYVLVSLVFSALWLGSCAAGASPVSPNDSTSRLSNEMKAPSSVATPQADDRDARIAALDQERRQLVDTLAAERRKTALTGTQQARISELERQLAVRDQDLARLRGSVEELERTKQQVASLTKALSDDNQEIVRLKAQLGQANTEDLARAKQESAGLKSTLLDREKEVARLQALLNQPKHGLAKAERDLLALLQPEMTKGSITVHQSGDRLTINLAASMLFDSGTDAVKAGGVDVLKRVGGVLKNFPDTQVQVDGHTDNVTIRGALLKKFPDNQSLSKSRAVNAMSLLEEGGVPSAKLTSTGYADSRPVASNASEAGRRKNRRVEIVVSQPRG